MAKVFCKSTCYLGGKGYVWYCFNYREYNRASHTLILFSLGSQYLTFYSRLEKYDFFYGGVYCLSLVKVESRKDFVNISWMQELNCIFYLISFNFQTWKKTYETNIYYGKCDC